MQEQLKRTHILENVDWLALGWNILLTESKGLNNK